MRCPVIHRTAGRAITRLVSPKDLGEPRKPLVFVDLIDAGRQDFRALVYHPHSGIATLSDIAEGALCSIDVFSPSTLGAIRSAVPMSGFYRRDASIDASNVHACFGEGASKYDERSPCLRVPRNSSPSVPVAAAARSNLATPPTPSASLVSGGADVTDVTSCAVADGAALCYLL